MNQNTRREFLKSTIVLSAAASLPLVGNANTKTPTLNNSTDLKILFQGDSITDGNRTRNNDWNHVMGHGYQYIISSKLWYEHPERKFHFFNRGVSGNKVSDLAGRWQTDTLDIKPDILSVLIGVNDSNEAINNNPAYTKESYNQGYRDLLYRAQAGNPHLKFVICEPFLLPVGQVKNNWERWSDEVQSRQIVARDIAREFKAVFVPFQSAFNEALKRAPADYWIWDGIHPMPAGHELMARTWLKSVKSI